ncbi:hypothetical protein MOV08_02220 [Streptomyces yunnanensis]|uniref:Uncharacterized protein n=1 Tax=Streptomyces yunnanensis TaxID=156453 RepID=A0ABY8A035_9ACTN|nr:hypothetical protein [Streptomyces yunnanensis]WEB38233.1 hypothetical protein MOV08_02220 [Streptomyces yunnanensis]
MLRLLRADPAGMGAVRIDPGDRDGHAAIRETFYGDVDETAATATAAISLLSADRPLGIPTETFTVTAGRYGTVPHNSVVCAKDNTIPVALQRRLTEVRGSRSPQPAALRRLARGRAHYRIQQARPKSRPSWCRDRTGRRAVPRSSTPNNLCCG